MELEKIDGMTQPYCSPDMLESNTVKKKERVWSIDRLRGICMFAMACSFFMPLFADAFAPMLPMMAHFNGSTEGVWMVLPGMSFADMFAPTFIFVIGLSMVYSYRSRVAKVGQTRALLQLAQRFIAIIGLGFCVGGIDEGWFDVVGGKDFGQLEIAEQAAAVCVAVQLILLVVLIITRFVKNKKVKDITKQIFVMFLAVGGICAIFFGTVRGGCAISGATTPYGNMWDTLYNIGFSCLLAVPFIALSVTNRIFIVSFMFLFMSLLYKYGLYGPATAVIEGGVIGAFGWAQIAILGTIFSELKDKKIKYWAFVLFVLIVPIIFIFGLDFVVAKRGGTPVYAWFTSAIAAILWGLLNLINKWHPKFDLFKVWGSNAILTYVSILTIEAVLSAVWEDELKHMIVGGAVPIVLLFLVVYTVILYVMDKRKIFIRI